MLSASRWWSCTSRARHERGCALAWPLPLLLALRLNTADASVRSPLSQAPAIVTTPTEATLAELRAALYDLADQLLTRGVGRHVLLDGIRHAWVLADLTELGEGPARSVLRDLQRELSRRPAELHRGLFAERLNLAADQL